MGMEAQLRQDRMLQDDENVNSAIKSGRDTLVLTTKRVLAIDVQGFTGNKVEYKSIPYTSIRGFSVQSAGSWDRDAELNLFSKTYWINGGPSSVFCQDLRKGRCDIIAMQSFLAAQVLGVEDNELGLPPTLSEQPEEKPDGVQGFLQWLGDDAHEIPADQLTEKLKTDPKILQMDETIEKAYKSGRDVFAFSNKRLLVVDVKGWTGQKVEYFSVANRYLLSGFDVQTPGMIAMGPTGSWA